MFIFIAIVFTSSNHQWHPEGVLFEEKVTLLEVLLSRISFKSKQATCSMTTLESSLCIHARIKQFINSALLFLVKPFPFITVPAEHCVSNWHLEFWAEISQSIYQMLIYMCLEINFFLAVLLIFHGKDWNYRFYLFLGLIPSTLSSLL